MVCLESLSSEESEPWTLAFSLWQKCAVCNVLPNVLVHTLPVILAVLSDSMRASVSLVS